VGFSLRKETGARSLLIKSLPWKIKLGPKTEAIKVLKFFLEKLEGDASFSDDIPDDNRGKDGPYDNDIPF